MRRLPRAEAQPTAGRRVGAISGATHEMTNTPRASEVQSEYKRGGERGVRGAYESSNVGKQPGRFWASSGNSRRSFIKQGEGLNLLRRGEGGLAALRMRVKRQRTPATALSKSPVVHDNTHRALSSLSHHERLDALGEHI